MLQQHLFSIMAGTPHRLCAVYIFCLFHSKLYPPNKPGELSASSRDPVTPEVFLHHVALHKHAESYVTESLRLYRCDFFPVLWHFQFILCQQLVAAVVRLCGSQVPALFCFASPHLRTHL